MRQFCDYDVTLAQLITAWQGSCSNISFDLFFIESLYYYEARCIKRENKYTDSELLKRFLRVDSFQSYLKYFRFILPINYYFGKVEIFRNYYENASLHPLEDEN